MTFSLVRSTRYLEYTTFWENDNKKKKSINHSVPTVLNEFVLPLVEPLAKCWPLLRSMLWVVEQHRMSYRDRHVYQGRAISGLIMLEKLVRSTRCEAPGRGELRAAQGIRPVRIYIVGERS